MSAERGAQPDYLELTYSEARLPRTDYPARLAGHLARRFLPRPGRIIDLGCGRGEFLQQFLSLGFTGAGVDGAASASLLAAGCEVSTVDLEGGRLPFPDDSFDYAFSKSLIEHLSRPEHLLREARRVLRPGGRIVLMTPSWRHTQRIFFEDLGHIRPFGANALSDALTLAGFGQVRVDYFLQLPAVWAFPPLGLLARATALLPLPYRPWDRAPWPEWLNRWIRFSKEVMLLGTAVKEGA
ncbi:MAG: class I SAM-dependent methyltransferase [Elusimicrobia bacterium]|nr:class I SAM-dependent methyltransferase [Elusimicrobiota bacterium]